ncbi:hypothetical protein A2755_00240 [Candidatus Wolfebacteria bacterium RIFCSPHIGHO2_01_FULL_48_22]|uniref:DUF4412 domain-containing protein n=1 Tax=Candidatus Wolfebacteria bacterium RIFCSPHIGHO2_01_FULL_48_22 TaxID=1802555 RepID=A0A1F8DV79_9BACT|nr:MAG: hypothetical protein A2755_00240 [Candidatus Wolfebacteria bacterium RIFCSPHIGHO2_01_FULL_48_22]
MKTIGWIVGIVVVAAVVYFAVSAGPSHVPTGDMQGEQVSNTDGSPTTMRQMLSGPSRTCTFSDVTEDASSQGTIYAANGNMRGDFSATSQGTVYASHMIIKDDTVYTWMDGMEGGYMMTMSAMMDGEKPQGAVDPDKQIDFDCNSWSPDSSKFNLPNMQFMDVMQLQTQIQGNFNY